MNYLKTVFKRCTTIPAKTQLKGSTTFDRQTRVTMRIFEGEHLEIEKNNFIGCAALNGLTPSPAGTEMMNIALKIIAQGTLEVELEDCKTKKKATYNINKESPFSSNEFEALNAVLNDIP